MHKFSTNSMIKKGGKKKTKSVSNLLNLSYSMLRSLKYGVRSLRKTPTEDTPTVGPGPTSGQQQQRTKTTTTTATTTLYSILQTVKIKFENYSFTFSMDF